MQVLLATGLRVCSGRCRGKVVLRPLQWKNICHGYISTLEDGNDVAKISLVSCTPAQPFGGVDALPSSIYRVDIGKGSWGVTVGALHLLALFGSSLRQQQFFWDIRLSAICPRLSGESLGPGFGAVGSWGVCICSVGLESIAHSLRGLEQVSPKARKAVLSCGVPISEELYSLVCLLCCSRVASPMLRIVCSSKPCTATRRALATTFPMAVCASQMSSGRV